jgi:hypothetical protein
VALLASTGKSGSRALDDQLAQILVASLGDADQARLATGGNLSRYQPKPSREIAAAGEGLAIADGGYQRRCVQHADAGNGRQPPGVRVAPGTGGELAVYGNPGGNFMELMGQMMG